MTNIDQDFLQMRSAESEARVRGMAFIVDGKHVDADRVFILSVPDTVGPISAMRTAKAEAVRTLAELEAFQANVSRPMAKQHVEMTGQHLSQLMGAVGLKKEPHWDNTYLGMHSYITMVDIEAKVRELAQDFRDAVTLLSTAHAELGQRGEPYDVVRQIGGFLSQLSNDWYPVKPGAMRDYAGERDKLLDEVSRLVDQGAEQASFIKSHETYIEKLQAELSDARADVQRIDWFDKQREAVPAGYCWGIVADSGITNVRLAMDSHGALAPVQHFVTGDTSMPNLNGIAPLPEGARWIDGILVTDPELAAPITDEAPGPASCACGVCGKLFSDDSDSLFCDEHR